MKDVLIANFKEIYGQSPDILAQAPGRIEFIGNHTDYNGGHVMGVAIDKVITVALRKRNDKNLCFADPKTGEKVIVDMEDLNPKERKYNWVNYPLGVFKFLVEEGMKPDFGFDFLDISNLPSGAGLSSSAAIEMASGWAFSKLYNFDTDLKTLVRIGRKSENFFVGMPCGILDQGVSGFGKKDCVVYIDCLSEEFSNFPLDHNCKFWLFNSTKKHALVDGMYAQRNAECMEASKILSGDSEQKLLRAFTMEDLNAHKAQMSEEVYKRARHVIEENDRVLKAKEAMLNNNMQEVGKLLTASHYSSKELFENSCEELDFLVETVLKQKGVYGARLSGGGFGGAIMALTDTTFTQEQADEVAAIYKEKFGQEPMVITCSAGDGAMLLS